MSIRTNANRKDRLQEKHRVILVVSESEDKGVQDSLRFWTVHPSKPCFVNLTIFASGQETARGLPHLKWNGPFSGRPKLIAEMAPAIQDHFQSLAEPSIEQFLMALRAWWRLLDSFEADIPEAPVVESTAQLSEAHRQRAFDQGMDALTFNNFLLLVQRTRACLELKPLLWQRPGHRLNGKRYLPPQWQTDCLRHELKHRWFSALRRWELAADLLRKGSPSVSLEDAPAQYAAEDRLLRLYRRLEDAIGRTGAPRPRMEDLCGDKSTDEFYKEHTVMESLRGRYPDGEDIRVAFHLCLATTGWNAAVLLSLNVDEPFIEPHPKHSARYIMRGVKARAGGAEQITEGLFKTRGGAAFVLLTLIERTAPLREHLRRERDLCRQDIREVPSTDVEKLNALRKKMAALERGVRSPWLFVSKIRNGIHWLESNDKDASFLSRVIVDINSRQAKDKQLSYMRPSDLRDAYAARIYHASQGSILVVMKALNHRSLQSTRTYLDNTLLREGNRKLYATFSHAMWEDIRISGRVDPSILAMWSRYGEVTQEQQQRLQTYRSLLRSRCGVGCKDPLHPPRHIAPHLPHEAETMCSVQRCLLCVEHAVIFPDSLGGLCKRLAEIRYLESTMSVSSYIQSSFSEEAANIELVLLGFDQPTVNKNLQEWEDRIASGVHRVVEFDGAEL